MRCRNHRTCREKERRSCLLKKEIGFSLIETLAALLIFSLVTLGVAPLILSSIRGASLSRSYTVGRNLAQQAMERVRGLPYSVAYNTRARAVDVLDLYYPLARTDGISLTTCTSVTSATSACPRNISDDYTVSFRAEFVNQNNPNTVLRAGTAAENYDPGYAWNVIGKDVPPSQLIRMTITTSWRVLGKPRSYQLQSLIADRRFGDLKFSGAGEIEHVVRVSGSFSDPVAGQSNLSAVIGASESTIESKLSTSAEQTVDAGVLGLFDPSGANLSGSPVSGATVSVRVPPSGNVGEAGDPVASADKVDVAPTPASSVSHGGVPLAAIDRTSATGIKARVAAELPRSEGAFTYVTSTPNALDFWAGSQTGLDSSPLALDPLAHVIEVREEDSNSSGTISTDETIYGSSSALATALSSSTPKTETTARAHLGQLRLFPTISTRVPERTYGGAVVVLSNFRSSVRCSSTGTAAAVAEGAWSATLRFWRDPEDGLTNGSYSTVNLAGALGADPLAGLSQTNNPLVWEKPDGDVSMSEDIYLFNDPVNLRKGYLQRWSTAFNSSSTGVKKDASGDETSARIPTAVTIETATAGARNGPLLLQVGSVSCQSLEFRI